jgi:hypothetical protein
MVEAVYAASIRQPGPQSGDNFASSIHEGHSVSRSIPVRSPHLLVITLLLSPLAWGQPKPESVAIHPCAVTAEAGVKLHPSDIKDLQGACAKGVEASVRQVVAPEQVRVLLPEVKQSCASGNQDREACLGELATRHNADRAVFVTLTLGKAQITRVEGVVVSAGGAVLYRQELTGDKELPAPKDPKRRASKVFAPIAVEQLSKQMLPHLLGTKRYLELRIEKPAQDSVVSGGEVLVEARLVLRKGVQDPPSEQERLDFTVVRGGDEASTKLTQNKAEKGTFSTVWTPTEAGEYIIQAAYPEGGLSAKVRVKVVPQCTQACAAHQMCTMKGCADCYSLSLQKPAQGTEVRVEQTVVEARLEMREACTQPAPKQLDFTVVRSDGGASTALTLNETEKGTYSTVWTPAGAGDYTLQSATGGVSAKVRVRAGPNWKVPVGYGAVGVGAVGVALTTIFAIQSIGSENELGAFYESGAAPPPSRRDDVERLRKDIENKRILAGASAVLGVASGIFGFVLLGSEGQSKQTTQAAPGSAKLSVGLGGVGIHVLLP